MKRILRVHIYNVTVLVDSASVDKAAPRCNEAPPGSRGGHELLLNGEPPLVTVAPEAAEWAQNMPEVLVPQNSDTVPLALYVGRVEPIACALERQRDGRQFRMKWIDHHCPQIRAPLV